MLVTAILYLARVVLVPLAIAGILALAFLPLARLMERMGMGRVLAALICGLLFAALIAGMLILLTWEIRHMYTDYGQLKANISDFVSHLRRYIHDGIGIDAPKQKDLLAAPVARLLKKA